MERSALGLSCKMGCPHHFQVKGFASIPEVVYIKFTFRKEEPTESDQGPMKHLTGPDCRLHGGRSDHVQDTAEVLALVDSQLQAGCPVRMVQAGVNSAVALSSIVSINALLSNCIQITPACKELRPGNVPAWCPITFLSSCENLRQNIVPCTCSFTDRRQVIAAVRAHVMEQLGIPDETCADAIAQHVKGSVYERAFFITEDFLRHRREEVKNTSFELAEQDAESVKLAVRVLPCSSTV
jgi:hypothetical protein